MTTECAVVVGLGQPQAGDDGVGLEVARQLAAEGVPARQAADATVVLDLLSEGRRVVVVDAVVGGPPAGTVLHLDPDALGREGQPASTHGITVAQALDVARALFGGEAVRAVDIVGVAIERPNGLRGPGLSPPVQRAVAPAAALARRLARC